MSLLAMRPYPPQQYPHHAQQSPHPQGQHAYTPGQGGRVMTGNNSQQNASMQAHPPVPMQQAGSQAQQASALENDDGK